MLQLQWAASNPHPVPWFHYPGVHPGLTTIPLNNILIHGSSLATNPWSSCLIFSKISWLPFQNFWRSIWNCIHPRPMTSEKKLVNWKYAKGVGTIILPSPVRLPRNTKTRTCYRSWWHLSQPAHPPPLCKVMQLATNQVPIIPDGVVEVQ